MGSSSRIGSADAHSTPTAMFLKEGFLGIFLLIAGASSQCCPTKKVSGADSMAGTYKLHAGSADFLPVCMDQCAYKKEGNSEPDELFCFKTDGAIHDVECENGASTPASGGEVVHTARTIYPGGSTKPLCPCLK